MYHPTTRLLTVLEILQSRQRIGGHELAARLEVDVRTVRRYVGMLQDLGIPVESTRGRYGAYRLRPGFKLPPLMFTEDEALAVVLGLLIARRSGLNDTAPAVEGALAKIERVLPAAVRERVQAVQAILVFGAAAPPETMADSAFVMLLSAAAQQHRRVWLRYRAYQGEASEREFDPYGLVHRDSRWYVAGYCHLRQEIRVFRLDRMLDVAARDALFTPPPDFDCLAQVEQAIARTPAEWLVEVVLQTTLDDARRQVAPTLGLLEDTPTGVVLRCYTDDLGWMARVLARLACGFVIRQPAELRDEVRGLAERLAQIAASGS